MAPAWSTVAPAPNRGNGRGSATVQPDIARLTVTTVLDATPTMVWDDLRHIADHTEWMEDAVAIRFTSPGHQGIGTTFDCDTRIGPFSLTDRMEITAWVDGSTMGVRHVGLVTGNGEFTLTELPLARTRFTWSEQLQFPWWMGGPIGARLAVPVLKIVWRRSLTNLAGRFG